MKSHGGHVFILSRTIIATYGGPRHNAGSGSRSARALFYSFYFYSILFLFFQDSYVRLCPHQLAPLGARTEGPCIARLHSPPAELNPRRHIRSRPLRRQTCGWDWTTEAGARSWGVGRASPSPHADLRARTEAPNRVRLRAPHPMRAVDACAWIGRKPLRPFLASPGMWHGPANHREACLRIRVYRHVWLRLNHCHHSLARLHDPDSRVSSTTNV